MKPSSIQKDSDFFSIPPSSSGVFSEFCSETAGKSMEESELVIAVGNIMSGKAIPDKTPNKLNASAVSYPASNKF